MLTLNDLRHERPTMSVSRAGQYLGVGKAAAYEYVRRGEIKTIQFNGRHVVPTAWLLRKLEIEGGDDA